MEHKRCVTLEHKTPKNMEGLTKGEITLEHNAPGFLSDFRTHTHRHGWGGFKDEGWGGVGGGQGHIERRIHIPHLFFVYTQEKVKR